MGCVEGALRVFAPIPYSMELRYCADARTGMALEPNHLYALKSGANCTVNSLGYRGHPFTVAKPPGRVRVAVMGGSSTFSYDQGDEQAWPYVMQTALRRHFGDHIDVINAGVPGYTVEDSVYNYLSRVRVLQPDIVVAYHAWNDIKVFPYVETVGAPGPRGVYLGDPIHSLLRHSQTAWRIRNFLYQRWLPVQRESTYSHPSGLMPVRYPDDGPAMRWERQHFEDLVNLIQADGGLPMLATETLLLTPENIQDHAVRAVSYVETVGLSFGETLALWQRIDQLQRTVSRERGVPFLNVAERVPHDLVHMLDEVHLSNAGAQAVGMAMAEEIIRQPDAVQILQLRT